MSVKVDIIAGFLGTGKTTLINKLVPFFTKTEKVVLIENEFGEVGIDGDLISSDLPMREIFAGCICCTLAGNFITAIEELNQQFHPDRIVIELSGVGQLSDVVRACQGAKLDTELQMDHLITIVDCTGFTKGKDVFGTFYLDQIAHANVILLSYIAQAEKDEIEQVVSELRKVNPLAAIVKEDWFCMDNENLADLVNTVGQNSIAEVQGRESNVHHGIQHLPAERIFTAWGRKDPAVTTTEQLNEALDNLRGVDCGQVWRGKGIVKLAGGGWANFDYTPGHCSLRFVKNAKEAKIAVIGCGLNSQRLTEIFPSEEYEIKIR